MVSHDYGHDGVDVVGTLDLELLEGEFHHSSLGQHKHSSDFGQAKEKQAARASIVFLKNSCHDCCQCLRHLVVDKRNIISAVLKLSDVPASSVFWSADR